MISTAMCSVASRRMIPPDGRHSSGRLSKPFFHLPDLAQVSVLEQFLERQTEADDQAFLDQFACHELALLSSRLDTQAIALLMDYANIVTDPEADARSDELLAVLGEVPEAVTSARQLIASHMTQRWGAIVDGVDTPTTPTFEPPDPQWHFYTVLDVFRDLLAIEDRDDRFRSSYAYLVGKGRRSATQGRVSASRVVAPFRWQQPDVREASERLRLMPQWAH